MMSAESNSEKSVSHQKKDGRSHARPSLFWYDNDNDLKVCFLVTHHNYTVMFWAEVFVKLTMIGDYYYAL